MEIKWLKFYLSQRKQCVKVGHEAPNELEVEVGAPQGSVLGPVVLALGDLYRSG